MTNERSLNKIAIPVLALNDYIIGLTKFCNDGIENIFTETETKTKFNPGDKVKVNKYTQYLGIEYMKLDGMEGIIKIKSYNSVDYWVDINGKDFLLKESVLDLIQSPLKPASRYFIQEYEDIDGVILQDQNKGVNMIMEFKR